jgi:hypothetical protein
MNHTPKPLFNKKDENKRESTKLKVLNDQIEDFE